jgi:hypothetical protein
MEPDVRVVGALFVVVREEANVPAIVIDLFGRGGDGWRRYGERVPLPVLGEAHVENRHGGLRRRRRLHSEEVVQRGAGCAQ